MKSHIIKVYPSKINLPKKKQLAWKIAEIASDKTKLDKNSIEMAINRIIDNASVAIASVNRKAVVASREMAQRHPRKNGATIFGIKSKYQSKIFHLEPLISISQTPRLRLQLFNIKTLLLGNSLI